MVARGRNCCGARLLTGYVTSPFTGTLSTTTLSLGELSRVGYCITLNGRPLNGHPPSDDYDDFIQTGHHHHHMPIITNCPSHTRKATIKARMTTGCYILQADVKRFNQNEVNATCLLCDIGEPENIDHFLCRCSYPPIKDSRERFLPRLIQLLHTALGFERLDEQSEYNEIVQLVLDCTARVFK